MSHVERMIAWFKYKGGTATLREILQPGEPWSYEWRARATDLRHRGDYDLVLTRAAHHSDNSYSLIEKIPTSSV
jgi:hypothetical protein